MAQIIRTRPGPTVAQDGSYPEARGGRKGTVGTQDMAGRYEEASYRQAAFIAANGGIQLITNTTTTPTTYTGLIVGNPAGSGKNLSLLEITFAMGFPPSVACVYALAYTPYVAPAQGTAIGPVPTLISSGSTSVAKVGNSVTLSSGPLPVRPILSIVAASSITPGFVKDDVGGALIVPPGQAICIVAIGASSAATTGGMTSFTWEEISL